MISESSRAAPRYLADLFRNGTPSALSDSELLERFAARRSEHEETAELAFAALLARHGPMVLRVCRAVLADRHEVEDAFQATFLVLAVRARSIRKRASVASWLHGVALRIASSERSRAARRRRHELVRAAMSSTTTADSASDPVLDRERALVIQDEIGRLPEKDRAAVVLCYLEGLTHEMAAEQLGWPVGSVKSRLARARDRLRVTLTRRGLAPAVVPLVQPGQCIEEQSAPAHILLGTPLFNTTVRGALKAGLGKNTLAGIVSAEAIALLDGALAAMTKTKLMLMAATVLTAMLLTAGAGLMAFSATRQENAPRGNRPGQEGRQAGAATEPAQRPSPPAAATTKPAVEKGPVVIQAEVVDQDGRRLPGADVLINVRYSRGADDQESTSEPLKTNGEGRVRLELARERPGAKLYSTYVWAHQPGRALATAAVLLGGNSPPAPIRLTLEKPARQTVTILGSDDRPIAGLRVSPISVVYTNRRSFPATVPDEWLDRLTVITNAKGVATLEYLPAILAPASFRASGPEVAPHALLLDAPQGKDFVVKLGPLGRLVGFVRTAAGEPLADVPVELWAQGGGIVSGPVLDRRATADEIVPLKPALKTGPQGAFQTPPTLLGGSSYRVAIRHPGFVAYFSDWVRLDGERATIPAIRLQPLQRLSGRVRDKQGRGVGGARVSVPGGGPSSATDADGRFSLSGVSPGKTVILVEHAGFWLQAWLVDPSAVREAGPLALARTTEGPGPAVTPQADPIPPEEARALADRLLAPYLPEEAEEADQEAKLAAIASLAEFDLDRALELFQKQRFADRRFSFGDAPFGLALKLAETDPARAEAMVESIRQIPNRALAYMRLAKASPARERARKLALLEQATTLFANEHRPGPPVFRLQLLSALAEQWLDLGERQRARLLLEEGKAIDDARFPRSAFSIDDFLMQLARLDPDQALERLRKLPTAILSGDPYDPGAAVAVALATDHPAKAEQAFHLWKRNWVHSDHTNRYVMRLCRRLARVDPAIARRVAASRERPAERAMAWAYVALGLAETKKSGAVEAIDNAIQEIDRLRESGPGPEQVMILQGIRAMWPTNPAVAILPVVERSAPERLAQVFWRAVALHPQLDPTKKEQLRFSNVGFECMLLARYDRDVAAVLYQPMDAYLRSIAASKGPQEEFNVMAILGKGCIDPRAAVALLESLTAPREFSHNNPVHDAKLQLAEALGLPSDKRWKRLWWRSASGQIALEE